MRRWLTPWSSAHAPSMRICAPSIANWVLPRAMLPPSLPSNTISSRCMLLRPRLTYVHALHPTWSHADVPAWVNPPHETLTRHLHRFEIGNTNTLLCRCGSRPSCTRLLSSKPGCSSPSEKASPESMRASGLEQHLRLAACIILAPLSITLYLLSWEGNGREPLIASAMAGPTGNILHLIGAVAASFFLPLGYLGMSLLGMRRAPWLATISAALSLLGWIPWAALISLDDLAYNIDSGGSTAQLVALWKHFNGDAVMTTFLLIYIIGHLLSAMLIGFMLGRLRLVPAWAAWAFALTSPLTMLLFPVHNLFFQEVLIYLICALWISSTIPAAFAMFKNKELAQPAGK